jgi:hypothetical protein
MSLKVEHGSSGVRTIALITITLLALALVSVVAYRYALPAQSSAHGVSISSIETGQATTESISSIETGQATTESISSIETGQATTESISSIETGQATTEANLVLPCNCSYSLNWAWPTYPVLADLKSASYAVVVAQVVSAQTADKNLSNFALSGPVTRLNVVIPITEYTINVTTVVSGSSNLEPGGQLFFAQIGGVSDGTNMSVTGYPTLFVGQSYVLFLSTSGSLLGYTNELLNLIQTGITTGGPQGLFSIHGGSVSSLNNMYPQADAWLPVKADGIPLAQFEAEVQAATTTTSMSSTGISTTTVG